MVPRLLILMYHGTPHGCGAALAWQLCFLRWRFDVVPLAALLDSPPSEAGRKPRVALTFDDGLRNNVSVAYPLLKRLGLPATFFVCPRMAAEQRWLWTHEARQRLTRLDEAARLRLARRLGHCSGAIESVLDWMKTLGLAARKSAEAGVRAATADFSPSESERERFDVAGWNELRALDPQIVTIGSHTLTHPILTSLPRAELEAEIGDSRRELEAALQRPADLFAYPNGDHDADARACARRYYRGAVTTAEDRFSPRCDPYLLPRSSAPQGALRLAWKMLRASA